MILTCPQCNTRDDIFQRKNGIVKIHTLHTSNQWNNVPDGFVMRICCECGNKWLDAITVEAFSETIKYGKPYVSPMQQKEKQNLMFSAIFAQLVCLKGILRCEYHSCNEFAVSWTVLAAFDSKGKITERLTFATCSEHLNVLNFENPQIKDEINKLEAIFGYTNDRLVSVVFDL